MAEKKKVNVPEPPKHLPADLQEKWAAVYEKTHLQSQDDNPDGGDSTHQYNALKEANRLLRVEPPKSHSEAMKLRDHEVAKREVGFIDAQGKRVNDGVLRVVTTDGKKYKFPVPKGGQAAAPPAGGAEQKSA